MASSILPRACRFQRPSARVGFTLVELLTLIGIISVLLGLMMPMFGKAREAANSAKCEAQERQILTAMMLHANEHDGYMPMVGLPHPAVFDPASLDDSEMQRYDYYGMPSGGLHLMSIQSALAPLLCQSVNAQSETALQTDIQRGTIRLIFHCPSNRDEELNSATVWDGGTGFGSYGFNEAALGWATSMVWDGSGLTSTPRAHCRLRGKATRFVHPSQLFLFTDASPRSDGGWLVYCDGSSDLSLRDFFVTTNGPPNNPHASMTPPPGNCANWDLIDTKRHRGRMNVAFADGHVENVALDEGTLANISMNKDFPPY